MYAEIYLNPKSIKIYLIYLDPFKFQIYIYFSISRLYFFSKGISELFDCSIGLKLLDSSSISFFNVWFLRSPCIIFLAHNCFPVLNKFNHPVWCWFITWWINFKIVFNTSNWVNSSVTKTSDWLIFILFTDEYLTWLDSHCVEQFDLRFGISKAINNPTIDSAITLPKSFLDQWINDVIRNFLSFIPAIRDNSSILWMFLYLIL